MPNITSGKEVGPKALAKEVAIGKALAKEVGICIWLRLYLPRPWAILGARPRIAWVSKIKF